MDITVALLIVVAVVLLSGAVERRLSQIERRTTRIERKLDLLLGHLGIQEAEPDLDQVKALLQEGKKVEAVKAYRKITDADLLEAKKAVDRMAEQL